MARGLPAIAQAREARSQGRTRWTTRAGVLAAAAVVAGLMVDKLVSGHDLASGRKELLAKQRAIEVTLGAKWAPLRDGLEADVLGAAKDAYAGDLVTPQARRRELRSQPGLYLRMRLADARDVASIRAAAGRSRKDAFVACFLREPLDRVDAGPGAFPDQPWNLGQAYEATRILGREWAQQVDQVDDELRLRFLGNDFDQAVREQIPVAIDVVERAKFFLLVLDEDVPQAAAFADGGPLTEDALQLAPHPARVHVFALPDGREILRLRRTGDARVIPAGEHAVTDPETQAAMQRQANNCALAAQVDRALAAPVADAAAHP